MNRILPGMRMKSFACLLAFGLMASARLSASYVISFLPASDYNSNTAAMNAILGISGYQFDSFESTTLIPGLTITLSGGAVPSPVTLTSLANLYNVNSLAQSTNDEWDGTDAVVNNVLNQITSSSATNFSKLMTFNYAPGTSSFGIGLSNFQSLDSPVYPITNHDLFVNGVDLGTIETLAGGNWTPGLGRDAYLIITATDGSMINSVGFQNNSGPDALLFDHLGVYESVSSAPEPATCAMFGIGTLFLVGLLRRKA